VAKDKRIVIESGVPTLQTTSDNIEDFTNDASAVAVGDAVYVSAADKVAKAANSSAAQECVGLVFEIVDTTNCRVLTQGRIISWSTGMTPGDRYYLDSTAGALTTSKPSAAVQQVVGIALSATDLYICPLLGTADTGSDPSISLDDAYTEGRSITIDLGTTTWTHSTAAQAGAAHKVAYSGTTFTATPHGFEVDMSGATAIDSASDVFGVNLIGKANDHVTGVSVGLSIDGGFDSAMFVADDTAITLGNTASTPDAEMSWVGGSDLLSLTTGSSGARKLTKFYSYMEITDSTDPLELGGTEPYDDALTVSGESAHATDYISVVKAVADNSSGTARVSATDPVAAFAASVITHASDTASSPYSAFYAGPATDSGGTSLIHGFHVGTGYDVGVRVDSGGIWVPANGGSFTFAGSAINLDPTGDVDLDMDSGQKITINIADTSSAFKILQGSNNYIACNANSGSEGILFGQGGGFEQDYSFLGPGFLKGLNLNTVEFLQTDAQFICGNSTGRFNIESQGLHFNGNYLDLNFGHYTGGAESVGIVAVYTYTATTDTVNGAYVAGVNGVSDPYVTTTGSGTFSTGDLVQFRWSDYNCGIYEVASHSGTTLTIRSTNNGVTNQVEDFTFDQFEAGASDSASLSKITVSVIRSGTDGTWETGSGSTTGISYTDIGGSVSLDSAYNGGSSVTVDSGSVQFTQTTTTATTPVVLVDYAASAFTGTPHGIEVDFSTATSFTNSSDIAGILLDGATNAGSGTSYAIAIDGNWDTGISNASSYTQTGGSFYLGASVTSLNFDGVDIDLDPTGDFWLDMDAAKKCTITIADNVALNNDAFLIQDSGGQHFIEIDTNTIFVQFFTNCRWGNDDTLYLGTSQPSAISWDTGLIVDALHLEAGSTGSRTPIALSGYIFVGDAESFLDLGATPYALYVMGTSEDATTSIQGIMGYINTTAGAGGTARSGGDVACFSASLIGNGSDTSGADYHAFYAGTATDNGGSAVYKGLYVATGYDQAVEVNSGDVWLADSCELQFGNTIAAPDIKMRWDGTDFDVLPSTDDYVWKWGNGTQSFDMWWYGNTVSNAMIFDAGLNQLQLSQVDLTLGDDDAILLGNSGASDASISWNGSSSYLHINAVNQPILIDGLINISDGGAAALYTDATNTAGLSLLIDANHGSADLYGLVSRFDNSSGASRSSGTASAVYARCVGKSGESGGTYVSVYASCNKNSSGGTMKGVYIDSGFDVGLDVQSGNIGLFGATPVAQQSTTGTTTGFTTGSGTNMNNDSTSTGGTGSTAYTFGDVVLALKNIGIMAV